MTRCPRGRGNSCRVGVAAGVLRWAGAGPVFLLVPGPGRVRLAVPALGLAALGATRKIFGNLESGCLKIRLQKMQPEGGFGAPCCCPPDLTATIADGATPRLSDPYQPDMPPDMPLDVHRSK